MRRDSPDRSRASPGHHRDRYERDDDRDRDRRDRSDLHSLRARSRDRHERTSSRDRHERTRSRSRSRSRRPSPSQRSSRQRDRDLPAPLLERATKRRNDEDISGPDLKKARKCRSLNDGPFQPPAGSSNIHPSSLPASFSTEMQPNTSKPHYCEEIYHNLCTIFPNIDKEYIKTFCPANWIPGKSHRMQFNRIVDTIFQNEHNWVIAETPNTSLHDVQTDNLLVVPNVDDAYEQLTAINNEDISGPDVNKARKSRSLNDGPFPPPDGSSNIHPSSLPASFSTEMQPNTSKPHYCEEIYHNLYTIFPNIDKEYIKTFCPDNWIPEKNHRMHSLQFNRIVDTIFKNEHNWVIAETPNTSLHDVQTDDLQVVPNVDDAYEQLTAIFPHADPHYLRSAAEKFTKENDMTTFIAEKLQKHDYPTREKYLSKIKVTEEQERYTKNFNLEQFLTLFPDPFKHFENDARKCTYNVIAVEFLTHIFSGQTRTTIESIYRRKKYNLSLTALSMNELNYSRPARVIPTENIQLLQEMAFVRHREEIRQHMQTVKRREEEEFNMLKAIGGLYTCSCCYDEECMPSKCSTCENGHVFCNTCIISGTDSKLADGETHVPCFLDCGSEFSIATFQKVLPPTKLNIFLKKRQAAEVAAAGLEGLVFCPFCDFASIPPEGDKVFKCFNPECMKESCIKCKEPNHVPYRCEEKKSEKARIYIEEKMTEALTRKCYNCKKTFFKEEGCNKMTCACGAQMCYICCQPLERLDGYNHFRGQGSDEVGKCPLWTDNAVLNSETVRKVEEEARKEVLRQDPTVNINTDVLAPAVQPSRPGPHDGVSDARSLANTLADRILNTSHLNLNNPQ